MILDISMILLVALFMIIGTKRGIAKTLYGLASIVLSGIIAYLAGRFFANLLYKNVILKSISDSVTKSVSETTAGSEKIAESVFKDLPDFFSGLLNSFGITENTISSAVDAKATSQAITSAVDSVIAPILISIFSAIFILALFLIVLLLFKLLGHHVLKLFELPIIRTVNSIFGGVFGLCEGVAIVFAAVMILRIILPCFDKPFISPELINSSYVFKLVYHSDFISLISDVI